MRRFLFWTAAIVVLLWLLTAPIGYWWMPRELQPPRRPMTAELIAQADAAFQRVGAQREDFSIRAPDGALLRGWLVRPIPAPQNASPLDLVLLFHGVADNRVGVIGQAEFFLRAGYGVLMMDSRAHGESEGTFATYGWEERDDVRAIVAALGEEAHPRCIFALGVSMGASIALQAAADEPRIVAVAAESPFSDLREAAYDYAGFHFSPWIGRTVFRPAVETGLFAAGRKAGFRASDVSAVRAVTSRPFPILLIADGMDTTLPPRHAQAIYDAATGPRQLWSVQYASHASAMGIAPAEYSNRVLSFSVPTACNARLQTSNPMEKNVAWKFIQEANNKI
jgi:fermentation-respiration switch protein FrsA (DUF1100 family)